MPRHPAKFSNISLSIFFDLLNGCKRVLDPFAGTCKIGEVRKFGFDGEIWCNELEEEWVVEGEGKVDQVIVGDALDMSWCEDGFFDGICTSPTFGNRMADHHNAKDESKRNTYTHCIGRKLSENNSGVIQWGEDYRVFHNKAWNECRRVLCKGGVFVLNISDHIRSGATMPVSDWHLNELCRLGFELEKKIDVNTPRNRFGANAHLRVECEHIFSFRRI